jgi:hypothetical protein
MPNDVFRAVDATLVMGVDDTGSPEGALADALISEYDLSSVVGRLRDLTVTVETDLRPFYEIGRRHATHLRPGVIRITGTAARAHVNGALLRLLLGDGATTPPPGPNFAQPGFNIISSVTSSARPGELTKVTIFGVKLENWVYHIPADDFVMESVRFHALRIGFEEA